MHKFAKFLDYVFVIRPTLLFPVWTLSLAGHWAQNRFAAGAVRGWGWPVGPFDSTLLLYLALFTLVMGGVFLLNQITDVDSDRLNNKLYLIANGDITPPVAYVETTILVALPIILAWFLHRDLALVMVLAFLLRGWIYSGPPFSFKDRPIGGLLINSLGGIIVFSCGWMIAGRLSLAMVGHALPYAIGLVAVYFFTTVPDMKGDEGAGKMTVAVAYGKSAALKAGAAADVIAILAAAAARDLVILIPTVLSLPFFLKAVRSEKEADVLKTGKMATLILSMTICIHYPGYFILILCTYFLSRWYYKVRFNLNYPSLRT